jgi:hypothetical protein
MSHSFSALPAFMARKANVDAIFARVYVIPANHFADQPDVIAWAHGTALSDAFVLLLHLEDVLASQSSASPKC